MQSLAQPINNGWDILLSTADVSKIACIPKKAIRLQMPDAWQTGVPFSRHAKEDMLLFTIGNRQGFSTFVNLALLEQGLQHCTQRFVRRAHMTFAYTLACLSKCQHCHFLRHVAAPMIFQILGKGQESIDPDTPVINA